MSFLLYILEEDSIIVSTDSLVTEYKKGPIKYANKAYPLPFIKSIIACTGTMELLIDWLLYIQQKIICNDIITLNNITQKKLKEIYSLYSNNSESTTTSIYQFGYSDKEKKHVGFAYRSTNDFNSEKLIPSIGIKPYNNIDTKNILTLKDKDIISFIIKMAIEQKKIDDQKDINSKIGIGGNIFFIQMKNNEYYMKNIYEFNDKNKIYNEMMNKIAIDNAELF